MLPPAVAGAALLMAFGRRGLLGPWLAVLGLEIPFTTTAVGGSLLGAGDAVYALNAKSVERYRDRARTSGGKSDPADAEFVWHRNQARPDRLLAPMRFT